MIKKILKWTAWISAILALLFVVAYWTSPYWVPGQLAKFLPPSIKLETLELERPGLTRTRVKNLTLQIDGDTQLLLELTNTELHYSLWQQKLLSVSAKKAMITVTPATSSTTDSDFQLPQTIKLPQLPINQLSIEQVQLKGIAAQDIAISDILFSGDDKQLQLSSRINWMGLEAEIATKVDHHQQQLTSVTLDVQQDTNQLTVSAQPLTQSGWQFYLNGQITKIPFVQIYSADLGTIAFDLRGTVKQASDKQLDAQLLENSRLALPINFNRSWFEQQINSYAKEYGLSLDTQQISHQANLELVASKATNIELNTETKTIKAIGQLDMNASNQDIQLRAFTDSIHLDLSKTFTASEQQVSSQLKLNVSLPKTQFQTADKTMSLSTDSIKATLQSAVRLVNGNLSLNTQQLQASLSKTTLKGSSYTVNLPAHNWQGSANWTQPLTSTLENNVTSKPVRKLNAQLAASIDTQVALSQETIKLTQLMPQLELDNNSLLVNYSAKQISLTKQPITLYDIKGSLKPDQSNQAVNGDLSFIQASYLTDNVAVDYVSGKFDWKLLKQSFTAKGSLRHSQNTIPIRYAYNLKSDAHNLQIDRSSLPMLTLKSWTPFLKAYPALQITGGELNINKLSGDPLKLLFEGSMSIDKLNLLYDKLALKNATISDNLSKKSTFQGSVIAKVDSIELATGIAINNLSFTLDHTTADYRFKDVNGQLLGGTISIPRFDMHKTSIAPFSLLLSNISLQQLLTALDSEKLSVSGNFDIILPLIIKPGSRQITNGTFISKKAGVLKLKSDKGKEANIAFQALENFHYKELSGTIDYNSDGDYIITLYALGSNPDLYNGFPIKLDLTLRGHLPNLLYSMLITGDMATPVIDDLKQKQLLKIQ